jgi:hypothetical protein
MLFLCYLRKSFSSNPKVTSKMPATATATVAVSMKDLNVLRKEHKKDLKDAVAVMTKDLSGLRKEIAKQAKLHAKAIAAVQRTAEKSVRGKATKAKKDPNAPKRPCSPYMFYCKEARPVVKVESPEATFGEVGKILGMQWAELSDVEKLPFNNLSVADSMRYRDEKAAYSGTSSSSSSIVEEAEEEEPEEEPEVEEPEEEPEVEEPEVEEPEVEEPEVEESEEIVWADLVEEEVAAPVKKKGGKK